MRHTKDTGQILQQERHRPSHMGHTLAPELLPIDEHVGMLGGVPFLQEVLELIAGWGDVVHHALQHEVIVLCDGLHIRPVPKVWVYLIIAEGRKAAIP